MKDKKELIEQLKQGTFYYYKFGLLIKSKIDKVNIVEDDFVCISFECGHVYVFLKNVKAVKRPGNIVANFKWCYTLKNDDNECIGYIGQIEEK